MNFIGLFILGASLQVCATGMAQVTIKRVNAPLEKVFDEIRKQAGYNFIYTADVLEKTRKVSINVNDATLEEVLTACFRDQPLTYSIVDKVVIVKERPEGTPRKNLIALIPIQGRVINAQGDPVPGVSIVIKGSNRGTTTDSSGAFLLGADKGNMLIFSYIGYQTKEVLVGESNDIQVVLEEVKQQLNEVVVTALGIERQKRSLGYSTTEVGGEKFTQARETNLGNALTGQVAGVSVGGVSTGPYGSSRVTIRGNASLKGENQPLYVIDGVPLNNTNRGYAATYGGSDFGDGLSTINPDDIESIQVLKGAAASALYGFRGGNGAILITTKSGSRARGVTVELNNNFTANSVIDLRKDVQYEYGQGYNGEKPTSQYGASASSFASWGAKIDGSEVINFNGDMVKYVAQKDNFKNFFVTGVANQTSLAVLGSSDKGNYRIGLSNMYQTPVTPNSSLKQQGVNFNGNFKVTKKLKVGLTANYAFEKVKNRVSLSDAPGNVIAPAIYLASTFDIRWLEKAVDDNGNELVPNVDDPYTNNPYFVANYFQNLSNRNRLTAGLTVRYELLDWLAIQGQVTRDGFIIDKKEIIPTGTGFLYGENGVLSQSTGNFREINANANIEANKKFNEFTVRAIVGTNTLDNQYSESGVYGIRHFQVPYFYSPLNITNRPYQVSFSRFKVNSIYGSADLGYRDFLFVNVTARNDWFSTLNPESNNYLYPSVSGSFVFSDVIKMPSWITFGKLRAAYASSSNGTTPYQNKLTYTLEGYTIGDQPIGNIVQSSIPNQGLKPVKISEREIGLNLQFLDNRLGLDLAVYNKRTVDDILNVGVSTTTGYEANVVNIGKLRNKGLEVLLTATPVRSKNFTWSTSFNIAVNDNKVLALAPPDNNPVPVLDNDDNTARWGSGVSIQHVIGLPYAQIVGYAYKRNVKGQIVYDSDGFPMSSDIVPVPLGSGIYKTTGGFSNEFNYRGINLSFLIDFKYGAKIYSGTNLLLYNSGEHVKTLEGREGGFIGKGVTEDDKENTTAVRAQDYFYQITTGDYNIGEEFVYDASFIKFRSLSLGYSLPASVLRKGFVKGLTLSLVGRNLWIIKKYTPNIDPESSYNNTNAQGLELSGYPPTRNLGFNVNVKF